MHGDNANPFGILMKTWLVCFDISDDKSRRKAGNLLLSYGNRVQDSVFEIVLNDAVDRVALKKALNPLVDDGDDLRFYYLPKESIKHSETLQCDPVAYSPAVIVC